MVSQVVTWFVIRIIQTKNSTLVVGEAATVRSDCGMIRFRRETGRIHCPQRRAFSTNDRIANADWSGRFEN